MMRMCYGIDNAINGIPSCLHGDFMNNLLRKDWGFAGLIVSDQDSIHDAWAGHRYGESFANVTALGIKAGCDQNDGKTYSQNGIAAVQQGLMTEHDVRWHTELAIPTPSAVSRSGDSPPSPAGVAHCNLAGGPSSE